MQLAAAAALPWLATPGSAVRDWHSTLVSASGFSSQQFLQPAVSRADSSRLLSHILPQPRLQYTQKFASIRRSSSKVSYTALQRRHSLSIAQQLAALPLRHRSGGSAAHHHCTHARKHLFTRRLRPPPCPSISSFFFSAHFFRSAQLCLALGLRHSLSSAFSSSFLSLAHGYGPLCVASVLRLCHCGVSVFTFSSRPWATCAPGRAQLAPRLGQPEWPSVRFARRGRSRTCYIW